MELVFIILFATIFAYTTYRRFEWGVFLLCLLLPTYLIRFNVGPVPSTLLEVMIVVLVISNFSRHSGTTPRRRWQFLISKQFFNSLIQQFQKNKLLSIGTLLFLLGATISVFTSTNTRAALGEWKAFYVEPILLCLIIISIFNFQFSISKQFRNSSIPQFLIFPLVLCGLATSLFAIYQHFTGFFVPHAFWANQNTYRVTGWYGFPNAVGLFLAPLVPLAAYLGLQTWMEIKKRIWNMEYGIWKNSRFYILDSKFLVLISCILFLIASPIAILFAKSTGGLVGILAGIGILLLFYKKTRLPAVALGGIGILAIIFMPNNPVKQELLAQDRSGQIRIAIWKETTEFLKDYPVTGAGLASYTTKIKPYHKTVNGEGIEIFHHAHNIFLTMWVNLGLTGFIGFLTILIWFYLIGFKREELRSKNYELRIFLIASMSSLLVTGLVDSPYIKNDLSIFFWLLIALMFVQSKEDGFLNS